MTVEFDFTSRRKCTYFDLDTLYGTPDDLRRKNPTAMDKIKKFYWANVRRNPDFDYMTKGIA